MATPYPYKTFENHLHRGIPGARAGSTVAVETGKHTPILYQRIKDVEKGLAQALDALREQQVI